MITLRVHIIFLLLFIGIRRSSASPAGHISELASPGEFPSPLETSHQEKLKEHHVDSYTIDDNGVSPSPGLHLDCQADSGYIQRQTSLITKLLNDGETDAQKQTDSSTADETILVLGKAGSGKTSLVQFLIANPKLQSKKVRSDTGEYIIEDGEKIGTSVTESLTLYPELVNYNATINFCDSPGFHDSRSSAHEIVSMDVMKSVTRKFKKAKILVLENYSSLQHSLYKDTFVNTLRHLNDFLVDIDRFKDHIALIATKIPLTYITTDDINVVSGIVTEEMHIESIMDYLNQTGTSLEEKIGQKIGKSKRDFYEKAIKLLRSLQARDENGKATRISVFRRPYKSGPLMNMPLLDKNKESLTKTIMNLNAVEVNKNDFDFTLSNEAKVYLDCLLKLTSENFKLKVNELSFKLNEFVIQKTQNYTSFHQVLLDLESFLIALKQLLQNLDETKNYNEFFGKIVSFISEQRISSQINYNEQIGLHVVEKYEEMLMKFVDTDLVINPKTWTLAIGQVEKYAEDEVLWYRSLNSFISGPSSYKMQKNKTEIRSTIFHEGSIVKNALMNLFVDMTGSTNLKQFIDAQGDTKKMAELESITNTLLKPSNITCDASGRLIVKGFQIRLAEISSGDLVRSHCNNITVKEVALLAVDTVYLDEDAADIFRGVNMFVAAPKWEVIGQRRRIVISGQNGAQHSDDKLWMDDSGDGRPGLPGGNGGSFFGIGLQFVNSENLLIESNGGTGGPGADGRKGERGLPGRSVKEKLKLGYSSIRYTFDRGIASIDLNESLSSVYGDSPMNFYCNKYPCDDSLIEVEVTTEDGECGDGGGAGGIGGDGGIGGQPGDQQLIELSDSSSQIGMQNRKGNMGTRGNMGQTGDRGMDGSGVICVQVKRRNSKKEFYSKCQLTYITSPACNTCHQLEVEDAERYTTTGIEQPMPKKSPDFTYYLLDYSVLLATHSNHTVFNNIITDFREAIQRKFSYSLNELGLLFFKGDVNGKS